MLVLSQSDSSIGSFVGPAYFLALTSSGILLNIAKNNKTKHEM